MKVSLDLDGDLTNEQIDLIVKKLQSKKKTHEPEVAVLTKEEKVLLDKLRKHCKNDYSPNDFDKENYFNFVMEHIEMDMSDMENDLKEEININEDNIEDSLDRISEENKGILEYKKAIEVFKKRLVEHKKMYQTVKQLEKEFAKRKKNT